MKKRGILVLTFLFILLFGSMTALADPFSLSQTKLVLNVGDSRELTVSDSEKTPSWTSYNVNVAKVDPNGNVTAVRKGSTTITARIGLTYKKCTVSVVEPSIKLNKTRATIYCGGTSAQNVQLKATVSGASKEVQWQSLNPAVALVDEKGRVTSVKAGGAVILATANGKSAACVVTVKENSILLDMDSMQLSTKGKGSSIKLTPTIVGTGKSVKWTTSDKTVATVAGGKVTGKNTGTAVITATANGVSATCEVTVIKDSVSISEEKVLLYTGETRQLSTNAGKKDVVSWNSLNEAVVTVDATGKITAVGEGTAVIRATLGETTDNCSVTVKDTRTEIYDEEVSLKTKGTDKTYSLSYQITGRKNTVKWISSNTKVVTVSQGKLTAKQVGTAVITATANGISDTVQVSVAAYDPTLTLSQSLYTLYTGKGNTLTLKATVDGPVKKAVWESSDPAVATVLNGKVTAVSEGQAVITASANGVTAECLITVKESKVLLETENLTLTKGATAQLPADVVGASQTLKYVSTNTKAVTVNNGKLTAKNYGEADIKVTANGVTAVCHVTVMETACIHEYDEGVITKEPTCVETGIRTFTCKNCGDSYTEQIPLKDHAYTLAVVTAPTCTEQGYTTHSCVVCGDSYKDSPTDALGHDLSDWIVTKEATETEIGEKKRSCSRCDYEETEEIPVTGHLHQYTSQVTESTCTEQGYTTYTCIKCGDTYRDNYTDELGHSFGEWVIIRPATETEKGEMMHTCTRCSLEVTAEIPLAEHQHQYVPAVTAPTCTEQGYTTYTCRCGDSYKDNYTESTGHTFGIWIVTKEATYTEPGERVRYCVWGDLVETEEIPIIDHTHQYVDVVTSPTCTEQGYTTHTCSKCADSYVDTYQDALGHSYGEWIVIRESTETEKGERKHTCVRCNLEETEEMPLAEHQHQYTEEVTEPTCVKQGYTYYYCSCGESYKDHYKDPLGHDYQEKVTAPTCTEQGYTTYTCTRCTNTYEDHKTPALDHDFGEWVVTKPATEETKGERQRTCTRCNETQTEELPVIEHVHQYVTSVTAPTCTEQGYTTYTCRCGDSHQDDFVDALKHAYTTEKIPATCTEQGYTIYTCSRCEDSYKAEYTDALGHDYVAEVTEPTCGEKGYTTHACSRCNDSYIDSYVAATGQHDDGAWVVVKEPQLGVAGLKELQCTLCGATLDSEEIEMLTTDGTDSIYYFNVRGEDNQVYQEMVIGHYDREEAQEMYNLVCAYRENLELQTLTVPSGTHMEEYTDLRAVETSYLWDHTRPAGYGCEYSENIALSNPDIKGENHSVQEIFDAWIASEGHRNNIEYDNRQKNLTCISVFYKRMPIYKDGVETGKYVYTGYWVETFK